VLSSDRSGRASFDPADGLRALARLVAGALGAAPAPAGPSLAWMSVDVSAHSTGEPDADRDSAVDSDHDPDREPDVDDDGHRDADIEVEHAETWRLVARAQAGDGDAFGLLYDRYVDTVYRFIYFRVNDRGLAEDFTSETFLRALRRISSISYQGRDIGAWFVTIARNIVFDHMKSARHRLEITTADTLERDDHAPSPESAVIEALTSERLMAAVRQLGDEQRECIMLRFIQGFSVSETAEVMNKNDGAIKALQHRAVRKLAELVGGELR
jgi:RNA polymerase sigma-70 factor, ECF subfamily